MPLEENSHVVPHFKALINGQKLWGVQRFCSILRLWNALLKINILLNNWAKGPFSLATFVHGCTICERIKYIHFNFKSDFTKDCLESTDNSNRLAFELGIERIFHRVETLQKKSCKFQWQKFQSLRTYAWNVFNFFSFIFLVFYVFRVHFSHILKKIKEGVKKPFYKHILFWG